MTPREDYIYQLALIGDLDYSEIRTGGDAEWAANGYRERLNNPALPLYERRFVHDFIRNLNVDFS